MPSVIKEFTSEEYKLILALREKRVNRIEIIVQPNRRKLAIFDILLNPSFRLEDEGCTLKILAHQER